MILKGSYTLLNYNASFKSNGYISERRNVKKKNKFINNKCDKNMPIMSSSLDEMEVIAEKGGIKQSAVILPCLIVTHGEPNSVPLDWLGWKHLLYVM